MQIYLANKSDYRLSVCWRAKRIWAFYPYGSAVFRVGRTEVSLFSDVLLTIVDNFTRESLAIDVGQGIKGDQVVQVLEEISTERGLADVIRLDNGPEFTLKVLDKWAYENGVTLDFSRPGKPKDNGYIESFNGRLREECLNANWFLSLEDARDKIGAWREDYNVSRPHMSLSHMTPLEFASLSGDILGKAESQNAGDSHSHRT